MRRPCIVMHGIAHVSRLVSFNGYYMTATTIRTALFLGTRLYRILVCFIGSEVLLGQLPVFGANHQWRFSSARRKAGVLSSLSSSLRGSIPLECFSVVLLSFRV